MRTLLLADESITIQRVIALTFADQAFRVVAVSSGQEAIDRLSADRPDIVLAGTTMPGVTGYDVARFVRSQPSLKDVPILLMTGAFDSEDEGRLNASGANGILAKPFEPMTVISRVKELLGIKGEAPPALAIGRLGISPVAPARPVLASSDVQRNDPGSAPGAGAAEGSPQNDAGDDYLSSLDAAFDSLDQKLEGGIADVKGAHALQSPMKSSQPVDPRSPGRRPAPRPEMASPDPVFEVDDDWFPANAKAATDLAGEQKQLVADMGIHDPELFGPAATLPASDLNLDLRVAVAVVPSAPLAPAIDEVADNFSALLAIEQGQAPETVAAVTPPDAPVVATPPALAPIIVQAAAPEITGAMLEQIAARVADRLSAGPFGAELRASMAATIRDTVQAVVSETSERLILAEIARVKGQAARE